MSTTDQEWIMGYAKQALSDLSAREVLMVATAAKCHRLHFLQMAAEKICKAHLIAKNGRESVKNIHTYVERNLPIIARHFYSLINKDEQIAQWQIQAIKKLSQEIELLAPACDHGDTRRDNSEYPWEDGHGQVKIPCDYTFPNIDDSGGEKGRTLILLIKLIRAAGESYLKSG